MCHLAWLFSRKYGTVWYYPASSKFWYLTVLSFVNFQEKLTGTSFALCACEASSPACCVIGAERTFCVNRDLFTLIEDGPQAGPWPPPDAVTAAADDDAERQHGQGELGIEVEAEEEGGGGAEGYECGEEDGAPLARSVDQEEHGRQRRDEVAREDSVRHDEVAAPPAGVVRRLDGGHARARSSFVVLVRTEGLRMGVGVSCGVAAGEAGTLGGGGAIQLERLASVRRNESMERAGK
jgi:hypothetical protein